jgi:hypothetical protein
VPPADVLAQRQGDAQALIARIWQPIAADLDALRANPAAVSQLVERIQSACR